MRQGTLRPAHRVLPDRADQQRYDNQGLQGRRPAKMRRRSARWRAYPDLHEGPLHRIDRALQGSAIARQTSEGIASGGTNDRYTVLVFELGAERAGQLYTRIEDQIYRCRRS